MLQSNRRSSRPHRRRRLHHPSKWFVFFLSWRNRHSALVLWVCRGAQGKAKFSRVVVRVIRVDVLVDGIVSHGVDFVAALELEVLRVRLIEINAHDCAGVEGVIVSLIALPPGVRHRHGKADKGSSPFLVNEDDALALGGGRGHRDGRAMEKRKSRERGCVMWLWFFFFLVNCFKRAS